MTIEQHEPRHSFYGTANVADGNDIGPVDPFGLPPEIKKDTLGRNVFPETGKRSSPQGPREPERREGHEGEIIKPRSRHPGGSSHRP